MYTVVGAILYPVILQFGRVGGYRYVEVDGRIHGKTLGSEGSSVFAVLVPACTAEWVAEATEYRSLK